MKKSTARLVVTELFLMKKESTIILQYHSDTELKAAMDILLRGESVNKIKDISNHIKINSISSKNTGCEFITEGGLGPRPTITIRNKEGNILAHNGQKPEKQS